MNDQPSVLRLSSLVRYDSSIGNMMNTRCAWANSHPLMVEYHDVEWGVPQHDDRILLEYLILDGAQAGLSWLTILKKREGYRQAFDNFDPAKIARYDDAKAQQLLQNLESSATGRK